MKLPILGAVATTTTMGSVTIKYEDKTKINMNPFASTSTSIATVALLKGYNSVNIDFASRYIDSLSVEQLAELDQLLNEKEDYMQIEENHKHI